jgi:2-polyprenyl-6-methoxyphenol hydroxylase-like FAD-dependent oxidoreductase
MSGRTVYRVDGTTSSHQMGKKGDSIFSIERHHLNNIFINRLKQLPQAEIFFETPAVDADIEK